TIMTSVEAQWPLQADGHRPMWVFTDAAEVSSLWQQDVTTEDLRTRVTGTSIQVSQNHVPYQEFLVRFAAQGGKPSFGVAQAYDILYLLAYSAVAVGNAPLTGSSLAANGLRKMVPSPGASKVVLHPQDILGTFAKIAAGQPIDV